MISFLADENISPESADHLEALGYPCHRLRRHCPHRLTDRDIMALAQREERIVLTLGAGWQAQGREIELYLKRADNALQQARDNLHPGHRCGHFTSLLRLVLRGQRSTGQQRHLPERALWSALGFRPAFRQAWSDRTEYSRMLVNAFNVRLDSDYEVKPSIDRRLAEDILRDARQFVNLATAYLPQEGSQ